MINETNDVIGSYDFKALKVDFEDDNILIVTLNRPERLNTAGVVLKEPAERVSLATA